MSCERHHRLGLRPRQASHLPQLPHAQRPVGHAGLRWMSCGSARRDDAPESHVVHDGNFLREHGVQASAQGDLCTSCHTQRQCAECHGITVPTIPSRLDFDAPMRNTMHRANFMSVHDQQAAADPAACVVCHSELFCVDCHTRLGISGQNPSRGNPHPPGWSGPPGSGNAHGQAARLDPLSCASCHGGAGEVLCVSCHQVGGPGGNPHPPGLQ